MLHNQAENVNALKIWRKMLGSLLFPDGHLNNIGVRQKRAAHKKNNFIDKLWQKKGQAQSLKSKTVATMIGGPKTFWEDQRAGGLKKVANVKIYAFFAVFLSTVRGRSREVFQIWIISAEKRPYPRPYL